MHTEDEAKVRWCPAARVSMGPNRQTSNQGNPTNPHLNCIASECMAWRWAQEIIHVNAAIPNTLGGYRAEAYETNCRSTTHGYCGLAGKP